MIGKLGCIGNNGILIKQYINCSVVGCRMATKNIYPHPNSQNLWILSYMIKSDYYLIWQNM